MKKLILIRHGESEWNKLNLFTGWTDVDLTENGIKEAYEAGKLLKKEGLDLRKILSIPVMSLRSPINHLGIG